MGKSEVIEQMFKIENKQLKLYDYQKKWVNDESQFRIVNKSRQTGFSFVCAAEALVKAMLVPRSVILLVSTGERGAIRLMKYIHDLWRTIPKYIIDKFPVETFSKKEFHFKNNGSQIYSLPNSPATVRGYPATDIYIDEFAFFENEEEMWTAILPSITRTDLKRRVSLISTPNGKLNTYYKIFEEIKDTDDDVWSRHFVHYTECPDIDLAQLKKTLTPLAFRQEYCCEFVDEVTSVLPMELILKCTPGTAESEDKKELKQEESIPSNRIIYAGIDFGKKRDSTIAVYFEKVFEDEDKEPTFIMRRMDMLTEMDYSSQMPIIKNGLKSMNVNQCWVDQTGVGEKLYEELQKENIMVNGIIFSRSWKEKAVTDMVLMMQRGKVKFLKNDELFKQLHQLERKITPQGNARFEHHKKNHDDIFWAIALALSEASHNQGFFGFSSSNGHL